MLVSGCLVGWGLVVVISTSGGTGDDDGFGGHDSVLMDEGLIN